MVALRQDKNLQVHLKTYMHGRAPSLEGVPSPRVARVRFAGSQPYPKLL